VMAAFGLGTLPALLVGGLLASRIKAALANHRVRRLLAAAYIGFGAWTMAAAWHHQIAHAGHGGHTTALEHSEGDGHSAREANHSSHPAEAQPDEGSVHQHHH